MPLAEQRIPNVPEEEWTEEVRDLFPIMLPPGSSAKGSDFNSILVLANHPQLSAPWLRLNAAVSRGVVLAARAKEIAILRVAWRARSNYEWVHHMLSGLREGLTRENFRALQSEDPGEGWDTPDRLIIAAADGLWSNQRIDEETWSKLGNFYSMQERMELLYVIGTYLALACILNTAEAQLEPAFTEHAERLDLPDLLATPTA